jgi:predicted glycosyltransferase
LHDEWDASVFVFPRDEEQKSRLDSELAPLPRVRVLDRLMEGPALIAAADLVVSAGGTMNREAAALGIPAWSVFTGPAPFIDICLGHEGRLQWVRTDREFDDAWRAGRPRLLERRGPYPEGIETILESVHHHLHEPRHATLRLTRVRPRRTSPVPR